MLVGLAIGCNSQAPQTIGESGDSNASVAESADAPGAPASAADEVPLAEDAPKLTDEQIVTVASWDEVQRQIADADVPVVLDVWSTSCIPCMQEFPKLVALESRYDDDRLRCISFCVDYIGLKNRAPEMYVPKTAEFLRNVDAQDVHNYLSQTPDTDVFSELDIPSLPAVLVFGADGSLKKKFVDVGDTAGFTYDSAVVPYVDELVHATPE